MLLFPNLSIIIIIILIRNQKNLFFQPKNKLIYHWFFLSFSVVVNDDYIFITENKEIIREKKTFDKQILVVADNHRCCRQLISIVDEKNAFSKWKIRDHRHHRRHPLSFTFSMQNNEQIK